MKNRVQHTGVKAIIALLAIGMFLLIGAQSLTAQTPTAAALLREGNALLKQGDFEGAVKSYETLINTYPKAQEAKEAQKKLKDPKIVAYQKSKTGNQQNQQAQQAPANAPYTGNGGKGMSLAILAPKGSGLTAALNYLPDLVQGEFVSNFSAYSAISVMDRLNLEKVILETLDPIYKDNLDIIRLGHVAQTGYIMTGTVTKTASGYALQAQITSTADGMTKASYSGACTVAELDNLTGVRRASLELLTQMGVTLKDSAKTELAKAAADNQVSAQTALAKGITAQRGGTEVAALSYYFQAAAFDPSLMEAASRSSILNADISSGNIGDNVRNDIAWRREWVARLTETEKFFDSFNRTESMPYTLFYISDEIKQGAVNYQNESVALSIETLLHGSGIWTVSIERALQAVYDGLDATKRKNVWGLASWPRQGVTNLNVFTTRSQNFTVVFELLNSQNKVIGKQTLQAGGSWGLSWSGRPEINVNADDRKTLTFQNVNANDISDRMTIRVATVNGTAAETAARNGILQIRAITRGEFDSNYSWKFVKGEIQGFVMSEEMKQKIRQGYGLGINIPGTIWGDPVVFIGRQVFSNMSLTEVSIPDSVISIGDEAFANNNLTRVKGGNSVASIGARAFKNSFRYGVDLIIPNSVTSIGEEAFDRITSINIGANVAMTRNPFGSTNGVNLFWIYIDNGKKAGRYYQSFNLLLGPSGSYKAPPSFPAGFMGTWKRDNSNTTLTFTANTVKASNQSYAWNLTDATDATNVYTIVPAGYWFDNERSAFTKGRMTIQTGTGGTLKITLDQSKGEDNWNGTWKKQ